MSVPIYVELTGAHLEDDIGGMPLGEVGPNGEPQARHDGGGIHALARDVTHRKRELVVVDLDVYKRQVLSDGNGPTKIWVLDEGDVAVSAVLTSMVDDAVTVWSMSTPARFARRGYGRAILADTLLRAKSDGAKVGLLGATPPGKPLYDATGWITLEHWQMFASAESVQFDG